MMITQAQSPQTTRLYPKRFSGWMAAGLSARAASIVSLAGCDTVEEVTRLGREYFEGRPNCAGKTLAELAALAGWPPKRSTAVDAIAAALALSVHDAEESREVATDVVIALRRSGFIISAKAAQTRL